MLEIPDVDIDVKDRHKILEIFPTAVIASQVSSDGDSLNLHKTGLYLQSIPIDPITGLSAFPYDIAEQFGYFKIDMITNHVYDLIQGPDEYERIMAYPMDWSWFINPSFFNNEKKEYVLTHLGSYLDLCQQYPPQGVEDVAILIALIRPGKKKLIGENWDHIREHIWKGEKTGYVFKKSHAIAFAVLVTVHAKLIARHHGLVQF